VRGLNEVEDVIRIMPGERTTLSFCYISKAQRSARTSILICRAMAKCTLQDQSSVRGYTAQWLVTISQGGWSTACLED
jgi:hypothetical protein